MSQTHFKHFLFDLLEETGKYRVAARSLRHFFITLIVLNIFFAVIETIPSVRESQGGLMSVLQLCSGFIFVVEYLLRLYVSDLHPPLRRYGPIRARLRYAIQPEAIVDFLAALPLLLIFVLPNTAVTVLVILRLLRFLKLARYSPALRSLLTAIVSERHALIGSTVIIGGVILLSATLMYLVEHDDQPEALASIPHAMWWAVTTITTVGYGDVVPVTNAGRMIAGFVMLMGYGLIALPVGIIASAFAREIHSRDFVVTWSMVARVPLFEDLSATEIAEVSKLLEAQRVRAGTVIAEKGEIADRMYFISEGAAQIKLKNKVIHLDDGDFFGELALIQQRPRAATVRAVRDCELLVLSARALQKLMDDNATLTHKILTEAEKRIAANMQSFADLADVELAQADIAPLDDEGSDQEPELFPDGNAEK
ncbi:cyclic nucleotide-gated ion channel [Roseibium sediminis]|uniref:cyclic nucleotide-gated ion channel n=1 Tax=Roseibium sediminis TaxID=1775174 RepID=UPI00123E21EA|nr:cyclic nucleotide-gated ion channel [Roseibium sediminis]